MNQARTSPIDIFTERAKLARFWFILFLAACIAFTAERIHMAAAFQRQAQFIVMDSDTYYLPKTLDFVAAKELHETQLCLAAETLLNRGPSGMDHPERLKRLFDKASYLQALKRTQLESEEFEAKQMHQKLEIGRIQLLQVKDSSVLASFEGQIIRSGAFDSKPFVEVLVVKGRMKFERNPGMILNGAYPTVVRSFEITTEPIKSK